LFWSEDEIADRLSALAYQPLISVILPTYNTDLNFLERSVQSVREQHYSHWQLCVADDGSSDDRVIEYLRRVAAQDPRVVVTVRESNGGISAASNTALKTAKGDFVVLLDHDDELHPFALLEVVRHLNTNETADLIYSDEDKIDHIGRRSQPAFKPDFDMDMFLSFDYLGHLVALRRSLVSRIGGFRSVCDGSQDWDLLIRAVEVTGPSRVGHIAKPLYHWRMHEDSTAFDLYSKPYARYAWARVISEHIERTGKKASAEPGLFYGSTRIKYTRPKDVGIAVFVKRDDGPLQAAAIGADVDRRSTGLYEVGGGVMRPLSIMLDGSKAGSPLASQGSTTPGTEAHDTAVASLPLPIRSLSEIPGEVFVFINRPIESVNHRFFDELAAQAMRPECGLVTGISLNSDGRTVHTGLIGGRDGELMDPFAGITFSHHGYMGQLSVVRSVEAIGDYFFAIRREQLSAVGGLEAVTGAYMPRLAHQLASYARKGGLLTLVTPYAVATFAKEVEAPAIEPLETNRCSGVSINPNLMAFQPLEQVLKGNI
jgi:glycosyltransferase involved in cell wall biosynthesis